MNRAQPAHLCCWVLAFAIAVGAVALAGGAASAAPGSEDASSDSPANAVCAEAARLTASGDPGGAVIVIGGSAQRPGDTDAEGADVRETIAGEADTAEACASELAEAEQTIAAAKGLVQRAQDLAAQSPGSRLSGATKHEVRRLLTQARELDRHVDVPGEVSKYEAQTVNTPDEVQGAWN